MNALLNLICYQENDDFIDNIFFMLKIKTRQNISIIKKGEEFGLNTLGTQSFLSNTRIIWMVSTEVLKYTVQEKNKNFDSV